MKHSVPESMKFKKLQRRLGVSRVVVAGTLELLWIATQKNAKRGDIGQYSNEEIAIECDWEGDPDELVEALTDTGWLDESAEHRLVVHDWQDHCPNYLKSAVKQAGGFVQGDPIDPPYSLPLEPAPLSPPLETPQIRNVTKRNVTKRNEMGTKVPSRKFQAPTLDEVRDYCTERRNGIDPEQFIDHYVANGWVQGKGKPIKNWQAAVRTWERNGVSSGRLFEPPRASEPPPKRKRFINGVPVEDSQ